MAIITISRGSYSMGKDVAERVAEKLGYECISREILLEASDQFNVPEVQLVKAIKDAPSFFERFTHGHTHYVSYIQSALTRHAAKDNVVYHGFAGHLLLKDVSHILKVRIIADRESRIKILMERENITKREAVSWISKIDKERRKWSKRLYGADPWDPSLYDLVIRIDKFDIDDAVEMICQCASLEHFKATPESTRTMKNLALACQFKTELIKDYPGIFIASNNGNIVIYADKNERQAREINEAATSLKKNYGGINNIEMHIGVSPPKNAV